MISAVADEVERFIYGETNLLDDRQFETWLTLLADDVVYWVPNADEHGTPSDNGVIVYENMSGLKARVARILHTLNPTQKPAPRTRHFLTNFMVIHESDTAAKVTANLLLYVAKDGRLLPYPGKVEYKLCKPNGDWRIREKKTYLITNDVPLRSLPLL